MQDGKVRICVLPQGKELLILVARIARVAGKGITPSQSQVRQHCNRIANHGSPMVQKLLIFPCRLRTFVGGEISLAAKQDRVESSEVCGGKAVGEGGLARTRVLRRPCRTCRDDRGGVWLRGIRCGVAETLCPSRHTGAMDFGADEGKSFPKRWRGGLAARDVLPGRVNRRQPVQQGLH